MTTRSRLWPKSEDFFKDLDEGIKLVAESPTAGTPTAAGDLSVMRQLYAVFVASTIKMDPESVNDPDTDAKLASVRMALLAAYNLGRQRERQENQNHVQG
jgi:hypothetical protein